MLQNIILYYQNTTAILLLSPSPKSNSTTRTTTMTKTPSPRNPDSTNTTPYNEQLLKKLKRLKPYNVLVSLFLFLFLFFYLGVKVVDRGFKLSKQAQIIHQSSSDNSRFDSLIADNDRLSSSSSSRRRVGFLDNNGCDLFTGKWVWDESYPLYNEQDCKFLDGGFRCSENGRPDKFYTKWRWQPKHCDLPRFDANLMLEKLRNRRVAFVGDSIGRNQWESLLCMLSSAIPNKDSIYEVNGNPITKHMGFLSFKFSDFNCTIEYYRAPFLVLQSRAPTGVGKEVKTTLKLDQMDWTSVQWKDADVLVLNTGHWWNNEKTIKGGCYFQEGNDVKLDMSVETAYQRSIETLGDWIRREVNPRKTQVIYRTYAPVHFRGGDWNTGGTCHMETLPDLDLKTIPSGIWKQLKLVLNALSAHLKKSNMMVVDVLNITQMTLWRKDGHASLYYLGPKMGPAPLHRQDCSHWCLPGVPDAWNEILYALFLKREAGHSQTLMTPSQQ